MLNHFIFTEKFREADMVDLDGEKSPYLKQSNEEGVSRDHHLNRQPNIGKQIG